MAVLEFIGWRPTSTARAHQRGFMKADDNSNDLYTGCANDAKVLDLAGQVPFLVATAHRATPVIWRPAMPRGRIDLAPTQRQAWMGGSRSSGFKKYRTSPKQTPHKHRFIPSRSRDL